MKIDLLDENITLGSPWIPPNIEEPNSIPKGDMPGDKIKITPLHISKAQTIFPKLLELLIPILNEHERAVSAVHGGSGVGKSEIGALLSYYLKNAFSNSTRLFSALSLSNSENSLSDILFPR